MRRRLVPFLITALVACEPAPPPQPVGAGVCDPPYARAALPVDLAETSGLAASRSHEGVFWTHNDSGGEAAVYAIDSTGTVIGAVHVRAAVNRDWEDIARAPCSPDGDGDCLFIAETGDNNERYPHVAVFRFPEPDPGDSMTAPADRFRFRYPDGPRDAEAIFVTAAGIHIVNKGRSDAIEVFRLRPPYQVDQIVEIERVQQIAPPPTTVSAQVTSAASSGDSIVVVRTYSSLLFFRLLADTLEPFGRTADLTLAGERQGEGVDLLSGGRLGLTSESQGPASATISLIRCDARRPQNDTGSAVDSSDSAASERP